MKAEEEPPEMLCIAKIVEDGTRRLTFVCPVCRETRVHGGGDFPTDGDGYRRPHGSCRQCWPDGYILREVAELVKPKRC